MKRFFKKIGSYIKAVEKYIREDVHNPLATMSNLGYVIFGFLSLGTNFIIGLLQIILGVTSGGFHWSRTDCWHKADIVGIYYVFATISFWLMLGSWGVPLGLLVGGVAHYSFSKGYSKHAQKIIGILGGLCLIPFFIQNGWMETLQMMQWFVYAVAVSKVANHWNPEENEKWYDTFHSVWHIFSSIGIFYLVN